MAASVPLAIFLICFVMLLVWLHRKGRHLGKRTSSVVPPAVPGCKDYDRSCLPVCAQCVRLAEDGCKRCERAGTPHCLADIRSNSSGRRTSIRWLHFPKCGATLAVSVLSYACADEVPDWHTIGMALRGGRIDVRMAHAIDGRHAARGSRCGGRLLLPFDGHRPVAPLVPLPSAAPRDSRGLVAMFRRPAQRLISAYLDNLHAWGLKSKERLMLKSRAATVGAFARYPGIAGCMAKMLAGYQCAANVELQSGKVVRAALATLRSPRFLFIGLTEEWDASICLLHRMLPGGSRPLLGEFRQLGHSVNSHRAVSWLPPSNIDGEYNASVLGGFVDEADTAIYIEAERIFRRNLAKHGPPSMKLETTSSNY